MLVLVYTCQNATLLEITCHGSTVIASKAVERLRENQQHTYECQHCLTTDIQNILFDRRGFAEYQSGQSWLVSENAHDS